MITLILYTVFSYIFAIGLVTDYAVEGNNLNFYQILYVIAAPITMPYTLGARR